MGIKTITTAVVLLLVLAFVQTPAMAAAPAVAAGPLLRGGAQAAKKAAAPAVPAARSHRRQEQSHVIVKRQLQDAMEGMPMGGATKPSDPDVAPPQCPPGECSYNCSVDDEDPGVVTCFCGPCV